MNELEQLQSLFGNLHLNTNFLTYGVVFGIILDFITGLLKGYKKDGEISSSKLRDGGFKKAGIILVIVLSYGLSLLFNDQSHIIFNSVQAYYLYTELISILENLVDLNVSLPPIIKKILGNK